MSYYPGVATSMQTAAAEADRLGLLLTYYNSGSSRNPLNGFRLFPKGANIDFFTRDPPFVVHVRNGKGVYTWLHGFAAGLEAAAHRRVRP